MQIEEDKDEDVSDSRSCWLRCCCCCKKKHTQKNPDLKPRQRTLEWCTKTAYGEKGYLIPASKKKGTGKTMEALRQQNNATKRLPSPEESIKNSNCKKPDVLDFNQPVGEINVSEVNNLLRRRLSLCVAVGDENKSGEAGEAIFPHHSTLSVSEATPILLSHLVTASRSEDKLTVKMKEASNEMRRRSSFKADIEKFRHSFQSSKAAEDFQTFHQKSMEELTDTEFLDDLMKTSHFMKEVLEKDWDKTKNYIKWIENEIKNDKYPEKLKSSEKWMVILYTSSDTMTDQLLTFRCMLVRLLLQHHSVAYEERDVSLPYFQKEFKERLGGEKVNIPQVYMQGLCVGGYRVIYGIHKLGLSKMIFQKFTIPPEQYSDWMFKKESKKSQLTLDVNLKAFPALQALAGSWNNDKLSPQHLQFVTIGKMVVKHAREQWYRRSSQPYTEPDLRHYTLYRLTILQALIAMNKVYKKYMDTIDTGDDESAKNRRRLSWLPKLAKKPSKASQ